MLRLFSREKRIAHARDLRERQVREELVTLYDRRNRDAARIEVLTDILKKREMEKLLMSFPARAQRGWA